MDDGLSYKEVAMNHIPRLGNGSVVSGDISAASPEHVSMASPAVTGGNSVNF